MSVGGLRQPPNYYLEEQPGEGQLLETMTQVTERNWVNELVGAELSATVTSASILTSLPTTRELNRLVRLGRQYCGLVACVDSHASRWICRTTLISRMEISRQDRATNNITANSTINTYSSPLSIGSSWSTRVTVASDFYSYRVSPSAIHSTHTMSVSHVNESITAQKGELQSNSPPSDSSTTRTKPRSIDLDRHSLATVFSYLQTKERIRVSQVSHGWYAITNDPIAWSSDQQVLYYFEDLVPPKPPRKFLAPPPPPRFPSRYRHLIHRLDLNPAGSPYLLGNMKGLIESDQYLRRLPRKRITLDDDYGNTVHLRVPREVDELAESAATVLEDYTGLTELHFISSVHTEKLMDTFCRAFFKLPPPLDQNPLQVAAVEVETNQPATPTTTACDSFSKAHTRVFKKVCIQLPYSSSLPIIFQSPLMHQIETLSVSIHSGGTTLESFRPLGFLHKLQELTFRTPNKAYSEIWTILQQLPALHTLSVEGVDCCTNASLPPSLTSLTLFLIHGDSFTREVFPSLSTATCPPRLTHLTLHLYPLTHLDQFSYDLQMTRREAFLWRLAEHVTTLRTLTVQYQSDTAQQTSTRVGWHWHEFIRLNRSALEVERLTIVRGTLSSFILTRPRQPPQEEKKFPNSFPPVPVTSIDISTHLPRVTSCVCFTLFEHVFTTGLKHLTLSHLIFDHGILHSLKVLPQTVQLVSLTLYPMWPESRITLELYRLFFRAIGRHTTLTELKIGGHGMEIDSRFVYEPDIRADQSGLQSLLACHSLTSIDWHTPPEFARSAIFRTLGQLAHLQRLQLVTFSNDHHLLPQLFIASSQSQSSPLQQLVLLHYSPLRLGIEDKPSCHALVQLFRPYVTRDRSITLNGRSLDVWEQELEPVKPRRCLVQ